MGEARARRRRVIVEGFQARFVVIQLISLAVGLTVFALLLFGPLVRELLTREDSAHSEIAQLFLHLHTALWPLIFGLFATLTAIFVVMSHRVAGPIYRFRLAFRDVRHGKLNIRVHTRERDYLVDEAAELDAMIRFLSARVGGAQRRIAELEQELQRARSSADGSLDVHRLASTIASLKHELDTFVVDAPDQDTRTPATVKAAAAAPRAAIDSGFSMVEILIATAILSTISAIAIPYYSAALETARVARAVGDIRTLDREIGLYRTSEGCLPTSLADINRDSLRDPWGRGYMYGAIAQSGGGGGGGGGGRGGGGGGGGGGGSCTACAGGCISQGAARKDRRLVPINADFDLYSMGKDGRTAGPLTAAHSQDDVVRGNSGGFIGLARTY